VGPGRRDPEKVGSPREENMEIPALHDILADIVSSIRGSQPLLIVTALLLSFLGYAIIKRLLKLVLFLAVFLATYAGLVYLMA